MNNLNSCFQSLRFRGAMKSFTHSLLIRRKLIECSKSLSCFKHKNDPQSLVNRNVLLIDTRFGDHTLLNGRYLRIINQYGFTRKWLSWNDYQRVLFRLMSNPTPAMTDIILKKRRELGPIENVLSVHIRCGGKLADYTESSSFYNKRTLAEIPSIIKREMSRRKSIKVMYLTTDSSIAENFLRQSFKNVKVYTLKAFQRGHTTSNYVKDDTMRRTILDMYLAAPAKHIVYTEKSGFSKAICYIGNAPDQMRLQSYRKYCYLFILIKSHCCI